MEKTNFDTIPQDFYGNLPEVIQNACKLFEGTQKDIFMLSLLVSFGATFSNVYTNYRGDKIYPNLYLAVYSRAGSGKGSLKWIRYIFDKINEFEISESIKEFNDIEDKSKKIRKTLFIAPNITSAQWSVQLAENYNNQGIILATEIETLTRASSSKEMGGFTDGL